MGVVEGHYKQSNMSKTTAGFQVPKAVHQSTLLAAVGHIHLQENMVTIGD